MSILCGSSIPLDLQALENAAKAVTGRVASLLRTRRRPRRSQGGAVESQEPSAPRRSFSEPGDSSQSTRIRTEVEEKTSGDELPTTISAPGSLERLGQRGVLLAENALHDAVQTAEGLAEEREAPMDQALRQGAALAEQERELRGSGGA
jgi:ribonuclease D